MIAAMTWPVAAVIMVAILGAVMGWCALLNYLSNTEPADEKSKGDDGS